MRIYQQLQSHKSQYPQPSYWLDILILTVLIGLFFSIFLGSFALFVPDGGRYAEIAREMVVSHNYLVPHLNGVLYFEKPPLFYWLQAAAIYLFGLNEWSMRIWPAIFGLLGCLLVYIAGRKFYDRATGILASLMLATSILYFTMSHLISLDMVVAVLISASLFSFLAGVLQTSGSKKRLYIWLAFIFAAFAVMTKGLIGIVFPCLIVGMWVLLLNKWCDLKKWYLPTSVIIFLLLVLPWHILLQLKYPAFLHFYFIEQQFLRYSSMISERYQPIYYYFAVILVGFFPWSVFALQAIYKAWPSWRQRRQFKIEVFLLLWIILILMFFSFSSSKLIPYILPIFPPLAILTSRYLVQCGGKKTFGITAGFFSLFMLGIILAGVILIVPHYYQVSTVLLVEHFLLRMVIIIMLLCGATFCVYKWLNFRLAMFILMFGMLLYLPLALRSIHGINHRSVKSLAMLINKLQQPGDEVISYKHYFQELPFYTQQRVVVVDWINELAFGIKHQDTSNWIITTREFLRRWRSKKRMFAVTYITDYHQLRRQYPYLVMYPLDRTEDYILLSNHVPLRVKK